MDLDEAYPFDWVMSCEPYPIALADALPPFDERWRGRVLDKVSYLAHMAAWGTQFWASTELFMVHLPHVFTDAPKAMNIDHRHPDYPNFLLIPHALARIHLEEIQVLVSALSTPTKPWCCAWANCRPQLQNYSTEVKARKL